MSRELTSGRWFDVTTAEQHKSLKEYGALQPKQYGFACVQIGKYVGPGRYMLLQYRQRCPRNCCDDDVNNVYTAAEVIDAVRDEMRELADVLKQAKKS